MWDQGSGGQPVLGVLVGDVSYDFTAELMNGLADAAAEQNVRLFYLLGMQKHSEVWDQNAGAPDVSSHNSVYDYTDLIGANAFIIACGSLSGFSGEGIYQQFLERFGDLPLVVLQERVQLGRPNQTYLVVDNYHSYSQCIEHLISVHHYTKIAMLSGPEGHSDAKERLNAYRDVMERHHLPVTPGMIAYGNYSEYVDHQVALLIDQNPGLQAIAFANDEMAKAGYRECRRRGLIVGRDLALVGFDNFSAALTLEPPLTTVSQDVFTMGKTAVEYALDLMHGKPKPPLEMRTEFLVRQSCGCPQSNLNLNPGEEIENAGTLIDLAIASITHRYVCNFPVPERPKHEAPLVSLLTELRGFAMDKPEEALDLQALASRLNQSFQHYTPAALPLTQSLEEFLLQLLAVHGLPSAIKKFAACISYLQQQVHIQELRSLSERFDTYRTKSWIAPELTRNLYYQSDEAETYRLVTERLLASGVRNVHICLLPTPQRFKKNGLDPRPTMLRMVASAEGSQVTAYAAENAPVIDAAHPFHRLIARGDTPVTLGFSIYSGENHYGILLCESDRIQNAFLHVIGLQMGMLIDFLDLRRKERAIVEELEDIREKNEILNFLSEYDQLCGLLNRRGFIERAIRLNRDHSGHKAYCAFMDLDYLKQINDTYGHSEGDVALQAVSDILRQITRADDLIGRIGGDEFVGLFLSNDERFRERFSDRLADACAQYNLTHQKPYLMDISVGVTSFICRQGLEISGIIASADKFLYEAKHRRTFTALRSNPSYIAN